MPRLKKEHYNVWFGHRRRQATIRDGLVKVAGRLFHLVPAHDSFCECFDDAPTPHWPHPDPTQLPPLRRGRYNVLVETALVIHLNITWCCMMAGEISEDGDEPNTENLWKVLPAYLVPATVVTL